MKKPILFSAVIATVIAAVSCTPGKTDKSAERAAQAQITPVEVPDTNGLAHAYFSSGCFWCVEAMYESLKGVNEAISGYAGGHTQNPTYKDNNTGNTGHAESVEVIYDPAVISFATLVDVYFGSQDITQAYGQGPDHGSQYRSIVFYQNKEQKKIIDDKIAGLNKTLEGNKEVAADVLPFQKFWKAEDYHQNYERNHPDDRYVRNVSIPRIKRFEEKFPELLKEGAGH